MFKLVVLCAFFAAANAKPGALIAAPIPITQYSTFLTPGATTITRQDSSVIHPSPLFYQAPLAYTHFIKKRSAQFPLTYAAPATYFPNYYAAATYNAPLIHSAQILPAPIASVPAVHLIKKRAVLDNPIGHLATGISAIVSQIPLISKPLISQPVIPPPQAPQPQISQPLIIQPLIAQPLISHLVKKRSASSLLNAYIAPTSYSHQSRFDLQTTHTPYSSISYASPAIAYSSPLGYSSPLAVSHVY